MSYRLNQDTTKVHARIPARWASLPAIDDNPIGQILVREQPVPLGRNTTGRHCISLDTGPSIPVLPEAAWVDHADVAVVLPDEVYAALDGSPDLLSRGWWTGGDTSTTPPGTVLRSLDRAFAFIHEDPDRGQVGLRPLQLGATHTVLGYWSTKKTDPATVVMPTGTGRTGTMLALWCAGQLERLLVLVPSDALRTQIAGKFFSLGVLQEFGVLSPHSLRPVVGQVRHAFATPENAVAFRALQCYRGHPRCPPCLR